MGNYTMFLKFENPRRGRQARNFSENDPKILDLKSSSEQIIFRKLSLGAPVDCFLQRLFSLLCLPFAVVYFSLQRFQYRNCNFMIRIAVRGLQFFLLNKLIYHLASQSFPPKSWNLAPNRDNLSRENHLLCLQNHFGR